MRKLFPGATRRVPLALACSALLLAAGCGHASPRVVAYVGDAEITPQQVESAVAAVSTTAEEGQTVSKEAVINAMIQGEMSAQIAEEQHISISDSDRDKFLKTTNLAPLLAVAGAKPIIYDVADQALVAKKVGAAAYLADIGQRQVKLNPLYGVLDPKQKTIVTDQSSSLSQPALADTPLTGPAELTEAELELLGAVFDLARDGNVEGLAALLAGGLPVNLTNNAGDTLLLLAAYHAHLDLVVLLLEHGADTARVNDRGQTALGAAVFRRSEPVVQALVKAGADAGLGSQSARAVATFFELPEMLALLTPPSGQNLRTSDGVSDVFS